MAISPTHQPSKGARHGKGQDILKAVEAELDFDPLVDPADVTLAVQEALDRYALIIDDSNVTVDTDGHTETLSGHVPTLAEHDAVMNAAWMASGVYDVHDELHITD